MQFKNRFSLDHDPSNPSIGHGEYEEQADDGACAE